MGATRGRSDTTIIKTCPGSVTRSEREKNERVLEVKGMLMDVCACDGSRITCC